MGCASSKPSSASSKSKKNKEVPASSSNNNLNKQQKNTTTSTANSTKQQQQPSTNSTSNHGGSSSKSDNYKVPVSPTSQPATPTAAQKPAAPLKPPHHHHNPELDAEPIRIGHNLLSQIKKNENQVIDYIVRIVRKELSAELLAAAKPKLKSALSANTSPTNMAAVAAAAQTAQDNEDLMIDIASKAINILEQPAAAPATYGALLDALNAWQFICKNQTHKTRICELTVETIRNCLRAINDEEEKNAGAFDLVEFLHGVDEAETNNGRAQPLTPPQTPQPAEADTTAAEKPVLLSRTKANELARILFLSNRARPVVHASPTVKDAYYVNKQLDDNTEVTITPHEVDEILNNTRSAGVLPGGLDSTPVKLNSSASDAAAPKTLLFNLSPILLVAADGQQVALTPEQSPVCSRHDESTTSAPLLSHDVSSETIQTVSSSDATFVEQRHNDQAASLDSSGNESMVASVVALAKLAADALDEHETAVERQEPVAYVNVGDRVSEANQISNSSGTESFEDATSISPSYEHAGLEHNGLAVFRQENGTMDPILKQSLLDDRFYNNDTFKTAPPVNGQHANDAATTIQSGFKGHAVRETLKELHQTSDQKDETAHDIVEPKVDETVHITPVVYETPVVHDTVDDKIDEKKTESAATTIQATYRGYKTRKTSLVNKQLNELGVNKHNKGSSPGPEESVEQKHQEEEHHEHPQHQKPELAHKEPLQEQQPTETPALVNDHRAEQQPKSPTPITSKAEIVNSSVSNPDLSSNPVVLEQAATKIQSTYRGFRTRKELSTKEGKNLKKSKNNSQTNENTQLVKDPEASKKEKQQQQQEFGNEQKAAVVILESIANPPEITTTSASSIEEDEDEQTAATSSLLTSIIDDINNNASSNNANIEPSTATSTNQNSAKNQTDLSSQMNSQHQETVRSNKTSVQTHEQSGINCEQTSEPMLEHEQQLKNKTNTMQQQADKGDETKEVLDKAAIKIQSTFRGYKTRKNIKSQPGSPRHSSNDAENHQQQKKRSHTNENDKNRQQVGTKKAALISDPEMAATKIQSTFRGYKTRKQLENKKPAKSGSKPSSAKSNTSQQSGTNQ